MNLETPYLDRNKWPLEFDELPIEDQGRLIFSARDMYKNLIKLQFQLCYHANISIRDLDNMTNYEYSQFYDELKVQKEEESSKMEGSK